MPYHSAGGGGASNFLSLDDTPGSYTAGSVFFASASAVTEDNSNLFWDDTNNRLGVGTSSPTARFHVVDGTFLVRAGTATGFQIITTGNTSWSNFGTTSNGITPVSIYNASNTRVATITATGAAGFGSGATTPNSQVQIDGSFAVKRTATAVNVNTDDEVFIGVTDTSVARTVTLDTDDVVAGRLIIIKDESGGAGTNNITIATEGSETIDGAATVTISANYGVVRVYSDGTNWFTF